MKTTTLTRQRWKLKWVLIYSVAATLAITACTTRHEETDLRNNGLQGEVAQMTEHQYIAIQQFDNVAKGDPFRPGNDESDFTMKFNKHGYITQIEYWLMAESPDGYSIYQYANDDPRKKTFTMDYTTDSALVRKTQYIYNTDGDLVQGVVYDSTGNVLETWQEEYNKKKTLHTVNHYDANGLLKYREVEKMDSNMPAESWIYNGNGELLTHHADKWKGGLRQQTTGYDKQGQTLMKVNFTYDKNGNLTEQQGEDGHGEKFITERNVYEYDSRGNWTRRIHYVGEKPETVTEREIEYYSTEQ